MVELFHTEALELLGKTKKESLDLIIIDPPYEINYLDFKWDNPDKNEINQDLLGKEIMRVLGPNGQLLVFCGWSNVGLVRKTYERVGLHLKNSIIWDRLKGRGTKTDLMSTREDLLWFQKNKKQYTFNKLSSNTLKKTKGLGIKNGNPYRSMSNVWSDIKNLVPWGKEKILFYHPTQKPIGLLERIVNVFSNEGDNVADFFMGTGVSAEACKNLKRNFKGCEKETLYFERAFFRVFATEDEKQLKLSEIKREKVDEKR